MNYRIEKGEGIGSALVEAGLEILKEMHCQFIVVLGPADYYPRFGFVPASTFGFRCQWEGVPDEIFMARVISAEAVKDIHGVVRFRKEFDVAMQVLLLNQSSCNNLENNRDRPGPELEHFLDDRNRCYRVPGVPGLCRIFLELFCFIANFG